MASEFIHLHTHSHYSLLSALPKINELVRAAKEKGMNALALTDNGNLYGAIEFYKTCKQAGIKPLVGIDAYVAARSRFDKQAGIDNRRTRLVLLAENLTGYKNLLKLSTDSHLEGFYYKPRVDRELLEKYHEGLIAILPSFAGDAAAALKYGDKEKALEKLKMYRDIFGNNNLFLEVTHHPEISGHEDLMKEIVEFAKENKVPLAAAHEVYYLSPADRQARETLVAVQSHGDFGDRENGEADFSFVGEEEIKKWFKELPDAIKNTKAIAERCNLELELGKWVFPDFKLPNGETADQELSRLTYEGLKSRNVKKTAEVAKRIDYELDVIKKKGYAPYFLVVSDLLRHAREVGILSTTRGSAGGSMVSYLTYITTVNPIEYALPFERFLNYERPSPPDVDMDIADNRRDEMIEYAKQKYGADKVAQVGTFGTMMARGAVRDVARALGYEYSLGDQIAKLIPIGSQGFPMTIDRAFEIVPELKQLYNSQKEVREIIDTAKKIEGCARHVSVHAAGVVISPTPLTNFVPLQFDPKSSPAKNFSEGKNLGGQGKIITQYDMYSIEEAGLLKLDFLGIKNLSILADAVQRVEKIEKIKVDLDSLPLDDKKTFAMLAKGETGGLFQLNGDGMTHYLKELKPTSIHDINAMVALYRPGPMESIPQYIKRKHEPRLVQYLDPRMKDILSASYGVLTYQDDVLLIAVKIAGYSWTEADKLRKAMGKKIPREMQEQREKLIRGAVKNGMTEDKAEKLWGLIEPFAAYGFCKAHAASYGRLAYQTAYMKAHFPAIYMSSVLTADSGDVEKIGETITECKRMGIPVLPPSVNESYSAFTVVKAEKLQAPKNKSQIEEDKIRFGLTTIKNFGEGISHSIIEERKRGGKFKSLGDFLGRVRDKNLNKKSLEALIKAGALDEFGDRGVMLANIERLLAYVKESGAAPADQTSLFGEIAGGTAADDFRLEPAPPAGAADKLAWEKELLGLYISGHPLDKFRGVLEKREINIRKVREEMKEGMFVVIGGIIEELRPVITKNSEPMAFLKIADLSGAIEVVTFPGVFQKHKDLLKQEACVAVKGKISHRNGEVSIIAEKFKSLT
jgi:DNA polymerase-3 subunit alpha